MNLQKLKERKRRPLVCVGLDRSLTHLEYLPNLYEAIKKRQVLKISYAERYGDRTELIFHPHLLKEYNGRWFVLGVDECGDYKNYSLDRIHSYSVVTGIDYIPIKDAEYKYWNQIIGVSHQEWTDVVHITLKTHSLYKHGLFVSKRFHESQHEVLAFGNHDGEEYGMLSIDIVPNKGQQILEASEDRNLTNIELLPFLYEAIKRKQVLVICYIHYTDSIKEELSLIVSPHYLKEFQW